MTIALPIPAGVASVPRGILRNRGISQVTTDPTGESQPLVRYPDALPLSEFVLRDDMLLYELPGESLMPFEGSGFSTDWELMFPWAANPGGLGRALDVLMTFDLRASYIPPDDGAAPAGTIQRSLLVSTWRRRGVPGSELPLNAIVGARLRQRLELLVRKTGHGAALAKVTDVLLWVDYEAQV